MSFDSNYRTAFKVAQGLPLEKLRKMILEIVF